MNWLTSRCAPLLVAASALALASCDKGTDLNVDLPDTAAINTEYQDLPLDVATVRLFPVQTLKTNNFLVGSLADNVAGRTDARAYLNVVGSSATDSLPSKLPRPVLDSVVVVMGFDKVYGSATTPVQFDVFKLATPLDERQVYDAATATALGDVLRQNVSSRIDRTRQQVVTPAVAATLTAAAVPAVLTTVPDQTVRLLLQRRAFVATPSRPAITAIDSAPLSNLFDQLKQPNFTQAKLEAELKGLAIVPSASHSTSIVSFGRTLEARMVVYFHAADTLRRSYSALFGPVYGGFSGTASSRDPRYYTQILNELPPALSALTSRAGFVSQAALGGTSYVQEGTGLGTRVTFTGPIEDLKKITGLTVNRAELRVPVKPFTNALFPNPAALYAVEVDANNNVLQRTVNFASFDRVVANAVDQFGNPIPAQSLLNDGATGQAYYSIPVTNYLQSYLTGKLDGNPTALVLVSNLRTSAALSLNRAVLDAPKVTLRVYYSKR